MDNSNCKHSSSSSNLEGTGLNETSTDNAEIPDVSVVQLNSKDELNWVENEIVIADSLNDKATTDSVDHKINDNDTNVGHNKIADEKVINASGQKHKDVTKTGDESEAKLWEYFTEHNSSQLRCNLCLGLFLYQSNASHLLKHVEVVHKVSVLPDSNVQDGSASADSETNNSSTSLENSDPTVLRSHAVLNNKESLVGATVISDCRVESGVVEPFKLKHYHRILEYFTTLESGKLRCNLCCRVLSYRSNRSAVFRHLVSNHANTYRYIVESIKENELVTSNSLDALSSIDNQNQTTENYKLSSEISEYFTTTGMGGKVLCKFCNAVLKFTEGANTNLIKHLKTKHEDMYLKYKHKSNEIGFERKKDTTLIILELIQEGDKCLITNAQLHTDSNQPVLGRFANSTETKLNGGNKRELSVGLDLNEDCENKNKKTSNAEIQMNESKRSKIWDYFTKLRMNNKVKCKMCSVILFCRNSIMKLGKHLARKHKIHIVKRSKFHNAFNLETSVSKTGSSNDENQNFEYELNNELTVDDISNINLFSILYTEKRDQCKRIKRKIKHKRRAMSNGLWNHYTKLYRDKAMCNICDKTFAYKLGQTSHLVKHLQMQHRFTYGRSNIKSTVEDLSNAHINRRINKTDIVWNFFTKLDDSRAECDLCEHINVLYYSPRSRLNLMKHLQRKHKYFLNSNYNRRDRILREAIQTNHTDKTSNNSSSVPDIDMKALFDYFSNDENLRKCIKFENDQIVCKLCTGMFLCDDLLNFEYTIKCHVQICHADTLSISKSLFLDNSLSAGNKPKTSDDLEVISNASYNELEAISNEINSYGK